VKLILQQITSFRGNVRMPFLAPEAAVAFKTLENDTGGLVYTDMWRDPTASLLAKRMKRITQVPGYSPHNYGIAIDIDLKTVLQEKKIRYEDLLFLLKKRGWVCYRRDGEADKPGSEHFNFLGDDADRYLTKCTMDPITWGYAAETKILERFDSEFQLSAKDVQLKLAQLGLYTGIITGQLDMYTREAILAFQRAWDLNQTGSVDPSLCRVLAFVSSDRQMI
jgi:hypothetical protein